MFLLEKELAGLDRWRQREKVTEIGREVVDSYLFEYNLLGKAPGSVAMDRKPLLELAYLNWRLLRRGYLPVAPKQWGAVIAEIGKVPRRKFQFEVLEWSGLLNRPNI